MNKQIPLHTTASTALPCPVFGQCGGCQIMHLEYARQLELKTDQVVQAFAKNDNVKNAQVLHCIPAPSPFGYRNKIQFPVEQGNGGLKMGLYAPHSHDLVQIDACPVHCEKGETVFHIVKGLLMLSGIAAFDPCSGQGELRYLLIKTAINSGEALVTFVTGRPASAQLQTLAKEIMHKCPFVKGVLLNLNTAANNVVLGKSFHVLEGSSRMCETLCGLTFKISPSSFFQVNTRQAENLYLYALDKARLSGSATVLDAYCGVGTLSLLAALKAKHVIGIECVPEAIEDAKENAQLNAIANASFFCGTVEGLIGSLGPLDAIFLNPPRKGCAPSVLSHISLSLAQTIIYISCNPATLARDASQLAALGYTLESVQPFDMFPQTLHVECIAAFIKTII